MDWLFAYAVRVTTSSLPGTTEFGVAGNLRPRAALPADVKSSRTDLERIVVVAAVDDVSKVHGHARRVEVRELLGAMNELRNLRARERARAFVSGARTMTSARVRCCSPC